jgi:hypothetical protein
MSHSAAAGVVSLDRKAMSMRVRENSTGLFVGETDVNHAIFMLDGSYELKAPQDQLVGSFVHYVDHAEDGRCIVHLETVYGIVCSINRGVIGVLTVYGTFYTEARRLLVARPCCPNARTCTSCSSLYAASRRLSGSPRAPDR